ncbi:MAG: zf-HC2 domain-containing protein [Deltaproteobacteria bacterium]|nr:zf-HC2 domain-containing protein [Deltaproteobacteria bacterium]
MTPLDVHPDELLDPTRLPSLTPAERARLDNHLAVCPACAFELAAREDFGRLLDADRPGEPVAVARLVARTTEETGTAAGPSAGTVRGAGGVTWSRRLLLVAAILGAAGGAAAASWYLVFRPLVVGTESAAPPPAPRGDPGVQAADAATRVPAPPPARKSPGRRVHPATPPVGPQPPDPVPPPAPPEERTAQALPPAPSRPGPERVSPSPEPREPPAGPATPAEALLQANELRRAGDFAQAATLYLELQRRFPDSREATLSHVTAGRLLLDRLAEPARALEQFDAYLAVAPGGTLAEDALVGRAAALQRLGRAPEERQAWTELLARFPATAQAERARDRLAELDGDRH